MSSSTAEDSTLVRKRHEQYLARARELADAVIEDIAVPSKTHHYFEFGLYELEQWFAKQYPDAPATAAPTAGIFDKITGASAAIKSAIPAEYSDSTGFENDDHYVRIESMIPVDDSNGLEDLLGDGGMRYDTGAPVPRPSPGLPAGADDTTGFE